MNYNIQVIHTAATKPDNHAAQSVMRSSCMQLHNIQVRICLYDLKSTKLILRKIIKTVATRCQILRRKCSKFDFAQIP